MGYYIGTEDTNIFLDKKHFNDVYKKMCELNDYDELKSGGSFGANNDPKEGQRYNPTKWFAWMDYNYPETCPDMETILERIGFDMSFDTNGNLINLGYWDKKGSEDYFLSCFAGFVPDGSYIQWKGEESEDYYRYLFKDGKMLYQSAEMTLTYPEEQTVVYEFGKMSPSDAAFAEWKKSFDLRTLEEKTISEILTDAENNENI